jgi:hypothetical protein
MRSLDNVRNTILGHLQIDYRIACAMSNFSYKPCETDGVNSETIALRMKQKAKKTNNSMFNFSTKQLRTNSFKEKQINDIVDFPRLSMKKIISKITLGTFHPKIALSYINDFINNVAYEYINNPNKSTINLLNTKIIATEIPSRHRRGKIKTANEGKKSNRVYKNTYKVFINYQAGINKAKAIKGISNFNLHS